VFYDDNQTLYDDNQTLYQGRGSLPSDLDDYPLTENVRNTRAIFNTLVKHYRGETPAEPRGPTGRTIERIEYESPEKMGLVLTKVLHRLLVAEGFTNKDLVVLTPKALDRSALLSLKLPGALRLVKDEPPITAHHHVLCSTIHSFKGLERRVVIVVAESDAELEQDVWYVAFSRPRTHLIVLGTKEALSQVLPDLQ